jgi:hypothetical protein
MNGSNNNNTPQKVKDEVGKNVQTNLQPTISEKQQSQSQALPSVKITSHTQNQEVPPGALTINGISSDTPSDICTVYTEQCKPISESYTNKHRKWSGQWPE